MPGTNHFTLEEIAQQFGLEIDEARLICADECIPMLDGFIDRNLFRIHAPQPADQQLAGAAA